MNKIASLASLLPLVAAHGYITSPTARQPGTAYEAACGQQPYYQQTSDINGNVQGILQVVGDDFDASACNLWLCKGFLLADSDDSDVQSYTAGESVDFKINIAAPHTGYANVSVVKTSSNSIIGEPLIEFDSYASNAGVAANNTAFSVTIPDDLGSECSTAGDCVLQWFWNAPDIDQTYEGCVDFTVGGSSGSSGSSTTAAVATSAAAATSVAATSAAAATSATSSVAAVAETSIAATTPLAAVTQTDVTSTPAVDTASTPASTPTEAAGDDDDDDCDDDSGDDDTTDDGSDDEDCDDEGDDDTTTDDDEDDCDDDEEETSAVASAAAVTQAAVTVTTSVAEYTVKATSSSTSAAAVAASSSAGSLSGSSNYGQSSGSGSKGSKASSAVTSYVTVTAAPKTQ